MCTSRSWYFVPHLWLHVRHSTGKYCILIYTRSGSRLCDHTQFEPRQWVYKGRWKMPPAYVQVTTASVVSVWVCTSGVQSRVGAGDFRDVLYTLTLYAHPSLSSGIVGNTFTGHETLHVHTLCSVWYFSVCNRLLVAHCRLMGRRWLTSPKDSLCAQHHSCTPATCSCSVPIATHATLAHKET